MVSVVPATVGGELKRAGFDVPDTVNVSVSPSNDWSVSHEDQFTTAGGGLLWRDILGKHDLSVDYTFARSKGLIETAVESGADLLLLLLVWLLQPMMTYPSTTL